MPNDNTVPTESNYREDILARIAHEISAGSAGAVGERPDDEELAALADNQLDDTRRAQVLSHLAQDAELYARWVALVSAMAYLGELREPEAEPARESMLQRVMAYVRAPAFGAAVTAMLLAVLVVPGLLQDYPDDIDGLYRELALPEASAVEGAGRMGRHSEGTSSARTSTTRQLLEAGVLDGLNQVQVRVLSETLTADSLRPLSFINQLGLIRPAWRARFELGRLTVLATLQCESSVDSDTYTQTLAQYEAIWAVLVSKAVSDSQSLDTIFAVLDQAGDAKYKICLLATRTRAYLK